MAAWHRLTCSLSTRRHLRWVLILYSVHLLVVLPYTCRHLPFSRLFWAPNDDKVLLDEAVRLNLARKEQAKNYFLSLNASISRDWYRNVMSTSDLFLVIPVVTVSRVHNLAANKDEGYLLQSASRLDHIIRSDCLLARSIVFICNVDAEPDKHEDAQVVKNYLPYTERHGKSNFPFPNATLYFKDNLTVPSVPFRGSRAKETQDYIYCLQKARTLNPELILMVEDDALPHRDFPEVLHHIIAAHLRSYNEEFRDFAFVKLYYPQRWQGYANEVTSILEVLSLGAAGGAVFAAVYWLVASRRQVQYSTAVFYAVSGGLFLILSVLLVGRQNVLELRRLHPALYSFFPTLPCCTQAMLFLPAIIPNLTAHLDSMPAQTQTDLAVYDFVVKSGIPAFQIEPNLFFHVGMYTSLANQHKDPLEFLFHIQ